MSTRRIAPIKPSDNARLEKEVKEKEERLATLKVALAAEQKVCSQIKKEVGPKGWWNSVQKNKQNESKGTCSRNPSPRFSTTIQSKNSAGSSTAVHRPASGSEQRTVLNEIGICDAHKSPERRPSMSSRKENINVGGDNCSNPSQTASISVTPLTESKEILEAGPRPCLYFSAGIQTERYQSQRPSTAPSSTVAIQTQTGMPPRTPSDDEPASFKTKTTYFDHLLLQASKQGHCKIVAAE